MTNGIQVNDISIEQMARAAGLSAGGGARCCRPCGGSPWRLETTWEGS